MESDKPKVYNQIVTNLKCEPRSPNFVVTKPQLIFYMFWKIILDFYECVEKQIWQKIWHNIKNAVVGEILKVVRGILDFSLNSFPVSPQSPASEILWRSFTLISNCSFQGNEVKTPLSLSSLFPAVISDHFKFQGSRDIYIPFSFKDKKIRNRNAIPFLENEDICNIKS